MMWRDCAFTTTWLTQTQGNSCFNGLNTAQGTALKGYMKVEEDHGTYLGFSGLSSSSNFSQLPCLPSSSK